MKNGGREEREKRGRREGENMKTTTQIISIKLLMYKWLALKCLCTARRLAAKQRLGFRGSLALEPGDSFQNQFDCLKISIGKY